MWPRKRLDIGWLDLLYGFGACLGAWGEDRLRQKVEGHWTGFAEPVACLSVRSGWDLVLWALALEPGSEVLVSAVTIPDMTRIIERHGLVPVPVDLDADAMFPRPTDWEHAITDRTRAILVAHLFGARHDTCAVAEIARRYGLLLVEDCAQAFESPARSGNSCADVTMFSFGPIKTSTALGGAVLCFKDPTLAGRIRQIAGTWSRQGRFAYAARLAKYSLLKLISVRVVYGALFRACQLLGVDHDQLINGAVRSFAGPDALERIRRRPSPPLLAVLSRRLARANAGRLDRRRRRGRQLVAALDGVASVPGSSCARHSHWVLPVLASDPAGLRDRLSSAGFDATAGQSMAVIDPPADRHFDDPSHARELMKKTLFLPLDAKMPDAEALRMAHVVREFVGGQGCKGACRPSPGETQPVEVLTID